MEKDLKTYKSRLALYTDTTDWIMLMGVFVLINITFFYLHTFNDLTVYYLCEAAVCNALEGVISWQFYVTTN